MVNTGPSWRTASSEVTHHAAALLFNRRRKVKGVNRATLRMREFVPTAGGIKILFDGPTKRHKGQFVKANLSLPLIISGLPVRAHVLMLLPYVLLSCAVLL